MSENHRIFRCLHNRFFVVLYPYSRLGAQFQNNSRGDAEGLRTSQLLHCCPQPIDPVTVPPLVAFNEVSIAHASQECKNAFLSRKPAAPKTCWIRVQTPRPHPVFQNISEHTPFDAFHAQCFRKASLPPKGLWVHFFHKFPEFCREHRHSK